MTITLALFVLTVIAMAFGFHTGRSFEAERLRSKPPGRVLDLHPSEWERVA